MLQKKDLQRLISLTFDEDPEVRKGAAKSLEQTDDPGALFALLELTYDKEESVKETARKILEKKGSSRSELVPLSELLSYRPEEKDQEQEIELSDTKKKLLHPIELLFEKHLGKEKAEIVKRKMMPSLEKVYFRSKKAKIISSDERRVAVQEFLTNYLDAISDSHPDREEEDTAPESKLKCEDAVDSLEHLEQVSSGVSIDGEKAESIIKEMESIKEEYSEEKEHEKFLDNAPEGIFRKAYEIMMYSGGDIKLMKKEMRRMIKNTERDIKMAFYLAKEKFKENRITKLTDIKEKMRNIVTDDLTIISMEKVEFKKPRSSSFALRFLVTDPQENEGVLYLFDGKGEVLDKGMKIKVVKGYAKVISGETALTVGTGGNVYIVV